MNKYQNIFWIEALGTILQQVYIRVEVEAGTSKTEAETWVAKTKTETEAI